MSKQSLTDAQLKNRISRGVKTFEQAEGLSLRVSTKILLRGRAGLGPGSRKSSWNWWQLEVWRQLHRHWRKIGRLKKLRRK